MVVTPPGRFSTIARQFSPSDNSLATIRLMMSGGVLAENGATKQIVPVGNAVWALAGSAEAANATITARCLFARRNNCSLMKGLPLSAKSSNLTNCNFWTCHSRTARSPVPLKSACIPLCGTLRSGLRNTGDDAMADPKVIKGLERGLLVLQALHMQPDSSLHEMHVVTSISKPSLLRILHTLARAGLVTRRLGDGRYRVGATLSHAPSRRAHRDRIAEAAAPIMERLCERVSWPSDLMVPAGDHMEIRETSRKRSPFLLQPERIGLPVNWLWSGVGRAYLAHCPATERQRIIGLLAGSTKTGGPVGAPSRHGSTSSLAEVRARGYGTRDAAHTGGYYGGPPHADGLLAMAVPLRDGPRVLGSINIVWLRTASTVEAFAARHLFDLQAAAAEIVSSLRSRSRR